MDILNLGENHKLITHLVKKLEKEEGYDLEFKFSQPPMKSAITNRYFTIFWIKITDQHEKIFERKYTVSYLEENYQEDLSRGIGKIMEDIFEFILERKLCNKLNNKR